MSEIAEGVRFSFNYLERGHNLSDSVRFRKRLKRLFFRMKPDGVDFAGLIEGELGTTVDALHYGHDWTRFFESGALEDVLDSVTVIASYFIARRSFSAQAWISSVQRILAEEKMGYRVDEQGGVHFAVDQEFDTGRASALAGLGAAKYGAARASFEASFAALDAHPQNTRDAIRHIYEALETIFRLILGAQVSRLGPSEIEKKLKPLVQSMHQGSARGSAGLLLNSFADWVNAAQPYRHGQEVLAPDHPPVAFTVAMVGSGVNFLRWLIEVDEQQTKQGSGRGSSGVQPTEQAPD